MLSFNPDSIATYFFQSIFICNLQFSIYIHLQPTIFNPYSFAVESQIAVARLWRTGHNSQRSTNWNSDASRWKV